MNANKIKLVLIDGIWHAEHYGPHAEEVRELFGTFIIPTPFLAAVPLDEVIRELKTTNPECEVI